MQKGPQVQIGSQMVGAHFPCYVIGEIGINHNGSLDIAKTMIDGAVQAGCSAVKFQKRTPELAVPKDQWDVMRTTPWGEMRYIDYRYRVEFDAADYAEIDRYCRQKGIHWFASCWDEEAVDFILQFDVPAFKAASASLTDHDLLLKMKASGKPLIVSTGMSTLDEIQQAVEVLGQDNLLIAHSTSSYPCPPEELNLRMIRSLQALYPELVIGYSGHETLLHTTYAAYALGAAFVERHITSDRSMWGTDQKASLELDELATLVAGLNDLHIALGDGVKKVYPSEEPSRKKLRRRL